MMMFLAATPCFGQVPSQATVPGALPAQSGPTGFGVQTQPLQDGQLGQPVSQGFSTMPNGGLANAAQTSGYQSGLGSAQSLTDNRPRVKDITTIEGHRSNRLIGMGLVVGLKGTGGTSNTTRESLRNFFQKFGQITPEAPTGNTAVVAVMAEVPPFARPGEMIDASVSVVDDATSIVGGKLIPTPLKGYDEKIYAMATGALQVTGVSASGAGATVAKNHDTTAYVKAQVEVPISSEPAYPGRVFRLLLTNKDNATAYRIAEEINRVYPNHARARDAGSVDVMFPRDFQNHKMDFVVRIGELRVTPDIPATVVVEQSTGTIVIGHNVKLSHVAFANGNLVVTTAESPIVSQPAPLSNGATAVVPRSQVAITETGGRYNQLQPQPTVGDLSAMLNKLGVQPRDFIAVLRSIAAGGHLQARLIIR